MHSPHGGPFGGYARNFVERQHALVYPVEHHGIGASHKVVAAKRKPEGRGRNLEHVAAPQAIACEYLQVLCREAGLEAVPGFYGVHMRVVGVFVCHEHHGVVPGVAQSFHEAEADYGGSAAVVAVVYDCDFHRRRGMSWPGRTCSMRQNTST